MPEVVVRRVANLETLNAIADSDTAGGEMLQTVGWLILVGLLINTAYGALFQHRRAYMKMVGSIEANPAVRVVQERLASRYLRNVTVMLSFKGALIILLLYWLTK